MVPTGAQAAVASKLLAELSSSDHPDAINVLSKDIYVDDVNPGAEIECGILTSKSVLQQGGFGFKYVVYSGSQPGDKTQFKFTDLDFILFLDIHEITGNLPVVLSDSPILYSYIMMIHFSRIQHAGRRCHCQGN